MNRSEFIEMPSRVEVGRSPRSEFQFQPLLRTFLFLAIMTTPNYACVSEYHDPGAGRNQADDRRVVIAPNGKRIVASNYIFPRFGAKKSNWLARESPRLVIEAKM